MLATAFLAVQRAAPPQTTEPETDVDNDPAPGKAQITNESEAAG
ncbi:hypothetical protein [Streptomyces sp. BP-8]|uniref:Uncharacterized protein n=1 Tax=Streptomyces sirii TaxID=3127701 RepID=A0ABZ2QPV8_9ACTN